jgi:hypothetical protein
MKKTLLRWARVLLGVYALVLAGLYWRQEVLLFRPHKLAEDHAFTLPADVKEAVSTRCTCSCHNPMAWCSSCTATAAACRTGS